MDYSIRILDQVPWNQRKIRNCRSWIFERDGSWAGKSSAFTWSGKSFTWSGK